MAYKINVVVAGRTYPITVSSQEEEQGVRQAVTKINKMITSFENKYAINDKQDALAMSAIQFASVLEVNNVVEDKKKQEVIDKVSEINSKLDTYLNS